MSDTKKYKFNPPPGWPKPPDDWVPPKDWMPDPSWPSAPEGWELWLLDEPASGTESTVNPEVESNPNNAKQSESKLPDDLIPDIVLWDEKDEEASQVTEQIAEARDFIQLDDEIVLQEVGIYRYHHPLENAEGYKVRLKEIESRKRDLVQQKHAIEKSNMFTFDNSLAKGRKMTEDLSKLMLRAYNAEADNCIRSLRAGNVVTAKKRIEKTREVISKLGSMMEMHISDEYHQTQLEELELTADYLMKKQEEKELLREERARLREEAKVKKELEAQRLLLDKECAHIANAIAALKENGESDSVLEEQLTELQEAIQQNDYRSANIRAGYVYVVSNRGAFGENVVKIGLTRRLEPIDRVNELGGASVPFRFDVHTLFFSEDAVTLETELHQHFTDKRLNCANTRKEFFFASPGEVLEVLKLKVGNILEFNEHAESTEYLQSLKYWPSQRR